jgi:hypothetical protein
MADKTTNYGLTKPTAEEFYNVNVQNENMDIIDQELKKKHDSIANHTKDSNVHITEGERSAWNNKADAKTENGGFEGGNGASTTAGGAVGKNAKSTYGGAVGNGADTGYGGAVGQSAESLSGGAVGQQSLAYHGGAIGNNAKAGNGFAGGQNAKAIDGAGEGIDAIQLGSGTNNTQKTLQVYSYRLMNADGSIPLERLKNVTPANIGLTAETWTFTLEDGSTVTKAVYVG